MAVTPTVNSKAGLVNRNINTAYDTVRSVADNIGDITIVATDIADIQAVAVLDLSTVIAAPALTAADVASTNADVVSTAADLVATNQDTLDTAADLALTNADVVLTAADVVTAGNSVTTAANSASAALVSENTANKWAVELEDTLVNATEYSAFHWAKKAQISAVGGLSYKGLWDASTTTYPISPNTNDFYIIGTAGTINAIAHTVGDHIIWNGTIWELLDDPSAVSSVGGNVGNISNAQLLASILVADGGTGLITSNASGNTTVNGLAILPVTSTGTAALAIATFGLGVLVTNRIYKVNLSLALDALATLNIDTQGALNIFLLSGAALGAIDTLINGVYNFKYDGVNLILLNPEIVGGAITYVTGGTSTAYTLDTGGADPVLGDIFNVRFHIASGVNPSITINGSAVRSLQNTFNKAVSSLTTTRIYTVAYADTFRFIVNNYLSIYLDIAPITGIPTNRVQVCNSSGGLRVSSVNITPPLAVYSVGNINLTTGFGLVTNMVYTLRFPTSGINIAQDTTLNIDSAGAKDVFLVNSSIKLGPNMMDFEGVYYLKYTGAAFTLLNPEATGKVLEQILNIEAFPFKARGIIENPSVTTGSSAVYTANIGVNSYPIFSIFKLRIHIANTGSATLNLDGLGAKPITLDDGIAITIGDMPLNHMAEFYYNGVNIILLNPAEYIVAFTPEFGNSGGTAIGPTYSFQTGVLRKYRRKVHAQFNLKLSSKAGLVGNITINNLPIVSRVNSPFLGSSIGRAEGMLIIAGESIVLAPTAGPFTSVFINIWGNSTGTVLFTDTQLTNTSNLNGSVEYLI